MITTVSAPHSGCWANTFKANAEAVEVVAHLVAIERVLAALAPVGSPDPDAH